MGKTSGQYGFVGTSVAIAGINQWSLDYTVDMLETTDFSASGVASYIPGVSRWSGTFSGFKDGAPKGLGTSATTNLVLSETSASTTAWQGTACISGIHPTVNHDGIVSYSYDFTGSATVTPPAA